jgi:hypothetical protein
MFKVIIAGGRDLTNYDLVKAKVDIVLRKKIASGEEIEIVSGKAKGADSLGEEYARQNGLKIKEFPADWDTHKKAAGPIRNEEMAKYADACIVFWDGGSRGSKDMIDRAKRKNMPLRIFYYGIKDTGGN